MMVSTSYRKARSLWRGEFDWSRMCLVIDGIRLLNFAPGKDHEWDERHVAEIMQYVPRSGKLVVHIPLPFRKLVTASNTDTWFSQYDTASKVIIHGAPNSDERHVIMQHHVADRATVHIFSSDFMSAQERRYTGYCAMLVSCAGCDSDELARAQAAPDAFGITEILASIFGQGVACDYDEIVLASVAPRDGKYVLITEAFATRTA